MSRVSSRCVASQESGEIRAVSDLIFTAGASVRKSVVVAGGDRLSDVLLAEAAQDHGIVARVILVGDEGRIREALEQTHLAVTAEDIIPARGDAETAAKAVACAQRGEADIIVKGGTPTTALYRELLKIRVRTTISVVTCFDAAPLAEGRPMLLTDPAVTVSCTYARLVDIIENAAEVARLVLGRERPKVAVLSITEEEVRALESSRLARALTERRWEGLEVYGPLSFDLAVDPQSVIAKKLLERFPGSGSVAGQADVLACTGIDQANLAYKAVMEMAKYGIASLANITTGLQVPVAPVSRSDPLSTRLGSIALASLYAQRKAELSRARTISLPSSRAYRVLAINPGSTSTKLSFFAGEREVASCEARQLTPANGGSDLDSRRGLIQQFLREQGIAGVDAVVGRGGLLPQGKRKLASGVYAVARLEDGVVVVDEALVRAVTEQAEFAHPSNLGIPLAAEMARALQAPAFTVDPVGVDEFAPEAEVSGYAPVRRRSTGHVLSLKAAARHACQDLGRSPAEANLVVAHLGGGVSIAALRRGAIVDSNIALLGDGPFTPQRAGALPLRDLIALCYSGRFSREELEAELSARAGLYSYLGTHDLSEIENQVSAGKEEARLVLEAMCYQFAKQIGAMSSVLRGEIEAVVVTGGLARSRVVMEKLRSQVSYLAPLLIYPGSLEMSAMAAGAGRALSGEEAVLRWADFAPDASAEKEVGDGESV